MATVLVLDEVEPAPGPPEALTARTCAAINALSPAPPLVLVAHGERVPLLPAVALSQRSSHRTVLGYLLIDPVLPAVTDSWPDAPVTVVSDDDWIVTQARLRGWDLIERDEVPGWMASAGSL
jgi:hypothetical protein